MPERVTKSDLRPFSQRLACVKCGHEDEGFVVKFCRNIIPGRAESLEYLHITCPRCSYFWYTHPKDGQ